MRKKKAKFVSLLLVLVAGQTPAAMAQSTGTSTPAGAAKTAGAAQVRSSASYAKLPLSFEPCFEAICADAGSQAKYVSRGSGTDCASFHRAVLMQAPQEIHTV
jgi:hypothetical protein